MSEFPDAPRLAEALQRQAQSIQIDPAERAAAEERLLGGDVTVLRLRSESPVGPPRRNRSLALVAAALAIVVVAALLPQRDSGTGEVATEPPESVDESAVVLGLPSLVPGHCQALDGAVRRYSVGGSEVLVGGTYLSAIDARSVVVLVPPGLPGGRQMVLDGLADQDVIAYVVDAGEEIRPVLEELVPIACGPGRQLVDLGTGRASEVACLDYGGTGFAGFVFVGPTQPPVGCITKQFTLVIDDEPLADEPGWLDVYGCDGGSVFGLDDERNVRKTYYDCDSQLLFTDTESDPLESTFNGEPLLTFIRRNVGLN
ncbi:MAG: hypothetical protein AAGA99_25460 [Actinomycetota bacterium]